MTSCFYRDGRVEARGGDSVQPSVGGQRQRTDQGVPEGGGPAPQLFRNRAGQVNRKQTKEFQKEADPPLNCSATERKNI
jgi:hypothetical protein